MKKKVLTLLVGCCALCSVAGLAACDLSDFINAIGLNASSAESESSSGIDFGWVESAYWENQNKNSSNDLMEHSSKEEDDEGGLREDSDPIPYDKINDFIEYIDGNSYEFVQKEMGFDKYYKIYDTKMFTTWHPNFAGEYYYSENGKFYKLTYDFETYLWNKNYDEQKTSPDDVILNKLKETKWVFYDHQSDKVTGELDGIEYVFNIRLREFTGDIEGKIENIGMSKFSLPTKAEIDDKTIVLPPDTSPKLYTKVGDEYVFDIPLLKEILTDWIRYKNYEERDLISVKTSDKSVSLKDIIYINATKENISFGIIYNTLSKSKYGHININSKKLYEKIMLNEIETKNQLIRELELYDEYDIDIGFKRFVDTQISDSDYDIIKNKTFSKLKNTGVQNEGFESQNPSTKIDFTNSKIIFECKTSDYFESSFDNLSGLKFWDLMFILANGTKSEFVRLIIGSESAGEGRPEYYYFLNGEDDKWLVYDVQRTEINPGNIELHFDAVHQYQGQFVYEGVILQPSVVEQITQTPTCNEGKGLITCEECAEKVEVEVRTSCKEEDKTILSRVEATCQEGGYFSYECSLCGQVKQEMLPKEKAEHLFEEREIVLRDGEIVLQYPCQTYGCTYQKEIVCKQYVEVKRYEASCLSQGYVVYNVTYDNETGEEEQETVIIYSDEVVYHQHNGKDMKLDEVYGIEDVNVVFENIPLTCKEISVAGFICDNCDNTYIVSVRVDHTIENGHCIDCGYCEKHNVDGGEEQAPEKLTWEKDGIVYTGIYCSACDTVIVISTETQQ